MTAGFTEEFHNKISPYSLLIKDSKLEEEYQEQRIGDLSVYRLMLIIAGVLYYSFVIVDYHLFNSLLWDFLKIRLFIVSPFMSAFFFSTYWKKYVKYSAPINMAAAAVFGSGIVLMAIVGKEHPDISRCFAGLVPYFMAIYVFMHMKYLQKVLLGNLLLFTYTLVEYFILKTPTELVIANFFYMSASNFVGMFVAYLLEYYGRKEFFLREKIQELAHKDAMTELKNRHYFDEVCRIEMEDFVKVPKHLGIIERRSRDEKNLFYGILMMDIDYFKKINDNYGHQAGDDILKRFAQILKENTRSTDYIIRWGGEEFLVILRETKKEYIAEYAEKIRSLVEQEKFRIPNRKTVSATVSIGYVGVPHLKLTAEADTYIKYADMALYRAKQKGRNRTEASNLLT